MIKNRALAWTMTLYTLFLLSQGFMPVHAADKVRRGKIIYEKQKRKKRNIKSFVTDIGKFHLKAGEPIFLLNFHDCNNVCFCRFNPFIVCISSTGTEAYTWFNYEENGNSLENADPAQYIKEQMKPIEYFLKQGHDIIIHYPTEKERMPKLFFKNKKSEYYYNEAGIQTIFHTLTRDDYLYSYAFQMQKALIELSTQAEDTLVVNAYDIQTGTWDKVDKSASELVRKTDLENLIRKKRVSILPLSGKPTKVDSPKVEDSESLNQPKTKEKENFPKSAGFFTIFTGSLLYLGRKIKQKIKPESEDKDKKHQTKFDA